MRFDAVTSTNDVAKQMAEQGEEEGLAVIARRQTAGRGRQERSWASPSDEGLYLSLILRPKVKPADSPIITLAAAVAVTEVLKENFNVAADIKWPNDVIAGNRKMCGILVEAATEKQALRYAIAGIGVNLTQREFPEEIRDTATSLLLETGRAVEADEFLPPLLDRLERWYRLAVSRPDEVIARWQQLSTYARGQAVRVISADEIIEGITRGLNARGALMIESSDGRVREVLCGEVSLRKAQVSEAIPAEEAEKYATRS